MAQVNILTTWGSKVQILSLRPACSAGARHDRLRLSRPSTFDELTQLTLASFCHGNFGQWTMASFNIISGTNGTQQRLVEGQTGRIAAGATLDIGGSTAVFISDGAFNGSQANPTLDNAGTISGAFDTVYGQNTATGTIYIRNTGTIVTTGGDGYAIWTPAPAVTILENAGALIGTVSITVQFGAANDIFVVRNGSSTNGVVDGSGGTDTLYYGL
jgi:hypothetical protein